MVKAYWNVKDFDRPRKYYKILKTGLDELKLIIEEQELMAKVIGTLKAKN